VVVVQHHLRCPTLSWPAPVGHFNISQRSKYTHILNEREIEIIEFASSNFTELINQNPPDLRMKVGRILPSYLWITEVRSDDSRQVFISSVFNRRTLFFHRAVNTDNHFLERDILSRSGHRLERGADDAPAAGNLHPEDGDALHGGDL